jgi:hypothetical protein
MRQSEGETSVATISFVRRARAVLLLTLAAGAIALAGTVAPASAGLGLACPDPTGKPFSPWSDNANYAFSPNGGFESGTTGWSVSGAKVAPGNESFYIHASGDKYSLSMPAGASATSPAMCISLLSGKMRFVARGDAGAKVKVQIVYRGLLSSVLGILDGGTYSVGKSWTPSPQVGMLGGVLPLLTSSVSFRFTSSGGAVAIDDVYLDPMKSS